MKISFLIANAYGMGGTIRTVFNTAGGLAARHEVEIASLARHQEKPFFPVPEGVRLVPLAPIGTQVGGRHHTTRGLRNRWHTKRLGAAVPPTEIKQNGAFTGVAAQGLRKYLRQTDADVVVGTRPGINLLIARWAPERLLRIGQEHVNLAEHKADVRGSIGVDYPRLDGLTVLTQADRSAYLDFLSSNPEWLRVMPNALPAGEYPRSTQENPIIVAAGRMTPIKQYPKLLEAFAMVAEKHPDWRLRIYGGGSKDGKLRTKIVDMGLSNQVSLMGRTKDLTGELAKASLLAVSSRVEGFGMTIIEGFSVGVPTVSFDCPYGPREIIDHERNGLLVPAQDVEALGAGLLRLVEDRDERLRMGEEAARSAADYDISVITDQWEEFLAERRRAKAAG
ncbi:glycosyltransferase family 4 protein [Nocardiopsis gilva YIM 90087]|uniref:Glycosyltransferase family 4 protein n=1 Tax=Nocardiopsis gilva YIM 90087 TaxID=1235441 RepID=A0A223SBM5_9ACTN|nr:glycosyltransferase family 4 protein [Nocardiopsis gilva]ASU85500.1 glycosyltransferase family 4 protein [Nocardiopsis gilva YIM 90087]